MLEYTNLLDLPIDIKQYICAFDEVAWINLAILDHLFYHYTQQNRKLFVNLFTKKITTDYETLYTLLGKPHREDDLPAIVCEYYGYKQWYSNGILHRTTKLNGITLPAVIDDVNHETSWWYDGKLHRTDLDDNGNVMFAKEECGTKYWFLNGKLHRTCLDSEFNTLPAKITSSGRREWSINGNYERPGYDNCGIPLPVIITSKGTKLWYVNGVFYNTHRPTI